MYWSLDTFCGAGGLSTGLQEAGIKPRLAFDSDRMAVQTFGGYHNNTAQNFGLSVDRAFNLGFLHGEVDILVGGPPCQPFSVHGKQAGQRDSRDHLPTFLKLLEVVKPRAFIMENVDNLAAKRHEDYFRERLGQMIEMGYYVAYKVLDAADFGVPQHRRRLFVVGFKQATSVPPHFRWPTPTHVSRDDPRGLQEIFAAGQKFHVTVGEALADVPEVDPNRSRVTYARNPVWRPKLSNALIVNGKGRVLDPHAPSPTVTAESSGNGGHIIDQDGELARYHAALGWNSEIIKRTGTVKGARRITWAEAARLQGFPDNYPFRGANSLIYRQIGNAVPPPLAAAVGRAVVSHLEEYTP